MFSNLKPLECQTYPALDFRPGSFKMQQKTLPQLLRVPGRDATLSTSAGGAYSSAWDYINDTKPSLGIHANKHIVNTLLYIGFRWSCGAFSELWGERNQLLRWNETLTSMRSQWWIWPSLPEEDGEDAHIHLSPLSFHLPLGVSHVPPWVCGRLHAGDI